MSIGRGGVPGFFVDRDCNPPFLAAIKNRNFSVKATVWEEPHELLSVDEYYYRSIATVLPIIVRAQCLRTDLVQAVRAVPFD